MSTSFFRAAPKPLPLEGRGFGGGVSDGDMSLPLRAVPFKLPDFACAMGCAAVRGIVVSWIVE
jgi:hypothetical protein